VAEGLADDTREDIQFRTSGKFHFIPNVYSYLLTSLELDAPISLNKSTISHFVVPLANKQAKKDEKKDNFHGESETSDVCFPISCSFN
jgi:hypothetical protein